MTAYYTCHATDDTRGCGSLHNSLRIAQRCCAVHRTKYRETRHPVKLDENQTWSTSRVRREYPMNARVAARKVDNGFIVRFDEVAWVGLSDRSLRRDYWRCDVDTDTRRIHGLTYRGFELPAKSEPKPEPEPEAKSEPAAGGGGEAAAKLVDALKALGVGIGNSGDEDQIRAHVEKLAAPALQKLTDVLGLLTATNDHGKELLDALPTPEALLEAARDAARNVTPLRIEVTTPERPEPRDIGEQHESFEHLLKMVSAGITRVFLAGPAGSGKTTAAENVAKALDRPFFVQPPVADKFEILGFRDANGTYQPTEFYRWAKAAPGAVLVLDEMDGSNPNALLAINTALANGYVVFPEGRVDIPREHVVIANGNTWGFGGTSEYVGRNRLDAATLNRFVGRIDWQYDERLEQTLALNAGGTVERVRASRRVRGYLTKHAIKIVWSPRDTVAYCQLRAQGYDHRGALSLTAVASLDEKRFNELAAESRVYEPKPAPATEPATEPAPATA